MDGNGLRVHAVPSRERLEARAGALALTRQAWYQADNDCDCAFELDFVASTTKVILSRIAVAVASGLVVLAQGCATSPARGALPEEEILERGGELRDDPLERSIRVTPSVVSVWGITEVPAGSRRGAAFAGVDAITRAELLKAIEVRVTSIVTVRENSEGGASVMVEAREAVAGVLDRAASLPHGWVRVRRGEREILRIWARLDVPRESLERALSAALARAGHEPGPVVETLELESSLEKAP